MKNSIKTIKRNAAINQLSKSHLFQIKGGGKIKQHDPGGD